MRLDASAVKGKIYVFVRDSKTLDKVDFYLDRSRRTKRPIRTDRSAPFDLVGTAADGTALPYDTTKLADCSHSIRVVLTWADGTTSSRRGDFKVANKGTTSTPTTEPTTTPPATEPTATTTTTEPAPPATTTAPPTTSAPTTTTAAPSDHDSTNDNGTHGANNDTARSERVVAKRTSSKDLRQCVFTERTGYGAGRCN